MTLAEIGAAIRSYREERGILRFVWDQFKVTPDPWQEQALLAYEDPRPEYRRISLQACAGPGKTATLAWCGWWFLGVQGRQGQHPKGAAVSISGDNLRDNLWSEFAKWQAASPFLSSQFTWTSGRIFANDHPETWFLSARAWPQSANADQQGKTLSGLHSEFVSAFIDESGAIPTTVLRAAEQALATCVFGKIMQAGNPISLEGMLHAAANELRHLWFIIRITGDPDDPHAWVHSPRVGSGPAEWAREQIATYGRENPWVMSYILGLFPPSSMNTLLGIEDVQAAMQRHVKEDAYIWAQKRLGVDVARFGDDRSVIFPRQGLVAFRPTIMRAARTTEIAAQVMRARDKWGGNPVTFVDDTFAWGNGVIDNLHAAKIPHHRVDYAAKALDPRYANRRAEFWIQMAEWVKRGGVLPNIPEMVAELTTPTYYFQGGKFQLEDKKQIKARLGRSPDLADALAQTFAIPEAPMDIEEVRRSRGMTQVGGNAVAQHDFDPFQGPMVDRRG